MTSCPHGNHRVVCKMALTTGSHSRDRTISHNQKISRRRLILNDFLEPGPVFAIAVLLGQDHRVALGLCPRKEANACAPTTQKRQNQAAMNDFALDDFLSPPAQGGPTGRPDLANAEAHVAGVEIAHMYQPRYSPGEPPVWGRVDASGIPRCSMRKRTLCRPYHRVR